MRLYWPPGDTSMHSVRREKRKRRQKLHKQAIYGTGASELLRGRGRTKELFVFRIEDHTNVDGLKQYIESKDVHVVAIRCLSKPEYANKSLCG